MNYPHEKKEYSLTARPVAQMPVPDDRVTDLASRYIYKRGLPPDLAFQNGWYGSSQAGDNIPRIVIPALNRKHVPYWQARALPPKLGEGVRRYESPFAPRHDSLVIVLPTWAVKPDYPIAITEGPFDALAVAECGLIGVSLMGNAPPPVVYDHIRERYNGKRFVVIADSDAVGKTMIWMAQLAIRGLKSQLIIPYGAKDFAAMSRINRMKLLEDSKCLSYP